MPDPDDPAPEPSPTGEGGAGRPPPEPEPRALSAVDAAVGAVDGVPLVPSTARAARLRAVRFELPSAFAGDHLVRLERLVGDFAAMTTTRSLQELGVSLEARSLWAHEMTWTEARSLPDRDAIAHVFDTAGGGSMMLCTDPALTALMAERLLDDEPDVCRPLRPVTPTDRAVISRFTDLQDGCLQQVWEEASDTSTHLGWEGFLSEIDVEIQPSEPVLAFAIETEIFGVYTVTYWLCTQSAFSPVRAAMLRPSRKPADDDDDRKRGLQGQIARVPVVVRAQIATLSMTPTRIATLELGDLIDLADADQTSVDLVVDGITMRRGTPGEVGHRVVVSLVDEPTR